MNWTIGIVTDGKADDNINKIIDSIQSQFPPSCYQILIVGNSQVSRINTRIIQFNQKIKPQGWITRKKNIIAHQARYQNLLIIHDYIALRPDWYAGFEQFGQDWTCAMCRIAQQDGIRFRDWVTWDGGIYFLDYNDHSRTRQMYISGSLMIIKKDFFLRFPLDQSRHWGQSEDVDFSIRARRHWNYRMNPKSTVVFLKEKQPWPITDERLF